MSIPPKAQDQFLMNENEVIERTASWLKGKGYLIESKSRDNVLGIDVVAFHPRKNERFFIEAKGNIKNKSIDKKQFTGNQIAHHFAVQLWQICELMHRHRGEKKARFGIANPYVARIINRIEVSRTALSCLPIELIWVTPKNVRSEKL